VSSYERALELAALLEAAGITATVDPRSATPPCVLIPPPERIYDVACGYTARWQPVVLVPGIGNADAHKQLDELVDACAVVLPSVERAALISYVLSPDAPSVPAYRLEFSETGGDT
jgi:hypothetical protein